MKVMVFELLVKDQKVTKEVVSFPPNRASDYLLRRTFSYLSTAVVA